MWPISKAVQLCFFKKTHCCKALLICLTGPFAQPLRKKSDNTSHTINRYQLELLKTLSAQGKDYSVPLMTSKGTWEQFKVKFILRMLYRKGMDIGSIDQFGIERYLQRIGYLETLGCKWFQIAEDPAVLEMSDIDLEKAQQWLNLYGYPVSISTLSIASKDKFSKTKKHKLIEEFSKLGSCSSDIYREMLSCSESDLLTLLYNNPSLIYRKSVSENLAKVKLLLQYEVNITDICQQSGYLQRITFKRLQTNLEKLLTEDKLTGLSLRDIVLQDQRKKYADKKLNVKKQSNYVEDNTKNADLQKLKNDSHLEMLSKAVSRNAQSLYQYDVIKALQNKSHSQIADLCTSIKLLRRLGCSVEDILQKFEIVSSLNKAKHLMILQSLADLGLNEVDMTEIKELLSEVDSKQNTRKLLRDNLTKVLKCNETELLCVPPDMKVAMCSMEELATNLEFLLTECGLTLPVIQRLPFILCQDIFVLRSRWHSVSEHPSFDFWKADPWKIVNIILYYIEKEQLHL